MACIEGRPARADKRWTSVLIAQRAALDRVTDKEFHEALAMSCCIMEARLTKGTCRLLVRIPHVENSDPDLIGHAPNMLWQSSVSFS